MLIKKKQIKNKKTVTVPSKEDHFVIIKIWEFSDMSRFINDSVEYYIFYVYIKVLLSLARGEKLCR